MLHKIIFFFQYVSHKMDPIRYGSHGNMCIFSTGLQLVIQIFWTTSHPCITCIYIYICIFTQFFDSLMSLFACYSLIYLFIDVLIYFFICLFVYLCIYLFIHLIIPFSSLSVDDFFMSPGALFWNFKVLIEASAVDSSPSRHASECGC